MIHGSTCVDSVGVAGVELLLKYACASAPKLYPCRGNKRDLRTAKALTEKNDLVLDKPEEKEEILRTIKDVVDSLYKIPEIKDHMGKLTVAELALRDYNAYNLIYFHVKRGMSLSDIARLREVQTMFIEEVEINVERTNKLTGHEPAQ